MTSAVTTPRRLRTLGYDVTSDNGGGFEVWQGRMRVGRVFSRAALEVWQAPLPMLNQIVTGDAHELATQIPDASIDLIFTDPIYENIDDYRWLAETAARVLKPEGALLTFCGIEWQEATQAALRDGGRPVRWILPIVYSAGNTPRFHPKGFAKWAMLLWAGGEPVAHFCDAQISTFEKTTNTHRWTKNTRPIQSYLLAFSKLNAVVLDPFSGGGTVPAMCRKLSRNFIAFEIDPDTAEEARVRVAATQAIDPVFLEEQESFESAVLL